MEGWQIVLTIVLIGWFLIDAYSFAMFFSGGLIILMIIAGVMAL